MAAPPIVQPDTPAIEVMELVKQFRIRHAGTFKRELIRALKRRTIEQFVALKGISFSVPHGETVAVIGRNGSGKSTLLGILSRVYKPTSGSVRLQGPNGATARVAPLLELGAGFSLELTGYENAEFYGAVLGMNAQQIRDRMPAIVAFAELEMKMDTPLHGWNDGAKLRLGFSVAVHIDPDILLVDEVLAVGDEAFQNKCYTLIAELQARGKTILFVSHDLRVVERTASRIIWLNDGVVRMDGETQDVLAAYRSASATPPA